MQFWDSVLNAAMIGTDKKTIGSNELPVGLSEPATTIAVNDGIDKEEKFLQLAALAFNYRQCAVLPLVKEQVVLGSAPDEEKDYCSSAASQVLKDILLEESSPLLKIWLQHCSRKNKIVRPALVPALLANAIPNKQLQPLITACVGKRGEWLGRFNEAWNFSTHQTQEEQWKTGTPDQRKSVLKELRHQNPAQAIEWLQQTWVGEDANSKQAFLEILTIGINSSDIPFLESLQSEKGKKIRDAAINLLKQIPGSSILQAYQEVLRNATTVKKEKALLGFSSKNVLHFQLPDIINDEIFKSGIEKLSAEKNITDESHIIFQLVSYIPPQFWENHLNLSIPEVINLFNQSKEGKALLPSIALAVGRFKDADWVPMIIKDENRLYLDLIDMLPDDKRETYIQLHFNSEADTIIDKLVKQETEWSMNITKTVINHTVKNPYQYTRSFYHQHIHLIPVAIVTELDKYTPSEQQLAGIWTNTRENISKLLRLKTQVIQSFI